MAISRHISVANTPQNRKIPGRTDMIQNRAGGYVFQIDDWKRLERFLILGSEGGTYYASERAMTIENAECVLRCIAEDGIRTVNTILAVSSAGRAPKNDPALLALALCATHGNDETRQLAYSELPNIARIGTHLFHFAQFMKDLGHGWGRGYRTAVQNWYKNHKSLALQAMKYKQRDGWSHRDMLRLSHTKPADSVQNAIFHYMVTGELSELVPGNIVAAEALKDMTVDSAVKAIVDHRLPWEVVPTEFRNEVKIWEALLENMPVTAMIRNLAKMTTVGLLKPGRCAATTKIKEVLTNETAIRKSRVHPLQILMALKTYESGRGFRGNLAWDPVRKVLESLDDAFYLAFGNVEPSGKRILIGLDISGSMFGGFWSGVAGIPNLTPAEACGAMCMVTARAEEDYEIMGFCTTFKKLNITSKMSLPSVIDLMNKQTMGGTDCSLPMKYAQQKKMDVDAFIVYTDNETWAGGNHPSQALKQYRKSSGISDSKLAVVGVTATNCSIADPNDMNMMDFVGFDTATPNLISDFVRG